MCFCLAHLINHLFLKIRMFCSGGWDGITSNTMQLGSIVQGSCVRAINLRRSVSRPCTARFPSVQIYLAMVVRMRYSIPMFNINTGTATMKTAIAYLRVSTTEQATEGVSLDAQETKIKAWCLLNDYTLAGVFVDAGVSGKATTNRPELLAALAACSKGSALVVYSLSRLARSTSDTLNIADKLQKKSVDLVSLSEKIDTTSASGKMVFRMLAVLAEFERDQISERTTTAMQHKKSNGERVGSVPYGSVVAADGVQLVADSTEQEIIRVVLELRRDGLSMRAIAAKLTTMGYKPRGAVWHVSTVANILKANAA